MAKKRKIAILLIAGASVITTASIQFYFLHDYQERAIAKAKSDAMAHVKAIERHMVDLDRNIDFAHRSLRAKLTSKDLFIEPGEGNLEISHTLARMQTELPEISVMGVTNPDGLYVHHSHGGIGVSLADRPYFAKQRAGTAPHGITRDLLYGRTTNAWTITTSRRLETPGGKFSGLFLYGMNLDALERHINETAPDPASTASVRTLDYRVVAHRGGGKSLRGSIVAPALFVDAIKLGETSGYNVGTTGLNVQDAVGAFVVSEHLPFLFTASVPLASYTKGLQGLFWGFLASLIAMVGGFAVLATAYRRELTHSRVLQQKEAELNDAQSLANLCSWQYDCANKRLSWSDNALTIFGHQPPEKIGEILTWIPRQDIPAVRAQWAIATRGTRINFIHRINVLGQIRWVREQAQFDLDSKGNPIVGNGIIQDITQDQQNLRAARFTASVFDNANEGIMISSPRGEIIEINRAMERITGYAASEVIGKNPSIFKSGKQGTETYGKLWNSLLNTGSWSGDLWNRRKNGELYLQHTSIVAIPDAETGKIENYLAIVSDITSDYENSRVLSRMAYYDILTDLPNRRLLLDRMYAATTNILNKRQGKLAILYLDLDGFKPVNDAYGHAAGDSLLRIIGQRIAFSLRDTDTASRLSGYEFAIMAYVESSFECDKIASRILGVVSSPVDMDVEGKGFITIEVSASIGISIFPDDTNNPDALLRYADQSMYVAKNMGKNCYHMFSLEKDNEAHKFHEMVSKIREGIENREFQLYYQPKVNLVTGKVIGAEALVRWIKAGQVIPPNEFLPAVEAGNLTASFSSYVIDEALRHQTDWIKKGYLLPVSVNIFAQQLRDIGFPETLESLLQKYDSVPPAMIELEIVETAHVGNYAFASEILNRCIKLGVEFAIDDFGTGHSSLVYLKQLPVHSLKIDQSFVRNITLDREDTTIVNAILRLAESFGYRAIAEGVETIEHGQRLISLGCSFAQGYAISKPIPEAEFCAWTSQYEKNPIAWSPPGSTSPSSTSLAVVKLETKPTRDKNFQICSVAA